MTVSDGVSRNVNTDNITGEQLGLLSPEEISCLVERLKAEADRYWSIDPNISVKYAGKIQKIGELTGNVGYLALGTMALGDAVKLVGHVPEAWRLLGEAGNCYLQIDDRVGWARTRIGRVSISLDMDRVDEAISDAAKAREILLAAGREDRCIWLEMNLGTVYNRLGDTKQALDQYQKALQIAEQLGPDGEQFLWPINYNVTLNYIETGQLAEAAKTLDHAIDEAVKRGDTRNLVYAMTVRSQLLLLQGKYREALSLLTRAEAFTDENAEFERLFTRRVAAEGYLHLNRNLEARRVAKDIVAGLEARGMPHDAARTRYYLAVAEARLGNYRAALNEMDHAQKTLHHTGKSIWVARQQVQRARILLKLGAISDAHTTIQQAVEVLDPGCPGFADATLLKGEVFLAEGRPDRARAMAEEALAMARRLSSLEIRYNAYTLLGQIAETLQRPERAARFYRAAVASLERSYRHLTITLRPGFLEDKGEALRALIRIQLALRNTTQAYQVLERSKSLAVLGYLADSDSLKWRGTDADTSQLIAEHNQLRNEITFFYHRVHHEWGATGEDTSDARYRRDVEALQTREKRMRAITDQLYLLNEHTIPIEDATLPTLEDVQSSLSANDVLIEYFNDGEQSWVFVVDSVGIDVCHLPTTISAIDALIGKLQANLDWALETDPHDPVGRKLTILYQRVARSLYDILVRPLESHITDHKRLIIVPYGALHYLPFNALFDGEQYLIEKQEIVLMPASSLLTRQIVPQSRGARAIAHSWDGKLRQTHPEAQDVQAMLGGEVYLEEEATRTVLNRPPLQVLHIAAHGEYRLDVPELSYLHLGDGQLFFDDVLQEDLSYELVVLSGCETGRANVMLGDEVIGLGRGFLYAGAGALLVSHWQADDTLTHTLMNRFYGRLADGASKASAVRVAQRELLREDPGLHPAFWGSFQLIGDPGPLSA